MIKSCPVLCLCLNYLTACTFLFIIILAYITERNEPMSYLLIENYEKKESKLPLNINHHCYTSSPDCLEPVKCFSEHNHESVEILLVIQGNLMVEVSGRKYNLNVGDTLIINPFEIHRGECSCNNSVNKYICLTFGLSRFQIVSDSNISKKICEIIKGEYIFDEYIKTGTKDGCELNELILKLDSCFDDKSLPGECEVMSEMYKLLAWLFGKHCRQKNETGTCKRNIDFMRKISRYLMDNYASDIGTADAAKALYMNISQFCRTFRYHFDSSFSNYLCRYRILLASEMYKGSELAISDIPTSVGFSDYCYFSRSFKKYIGVTPAIYFKKWKQSF